MAIWQPPASNDALADAPERSTLGNLAIALNAFSIFKWLGSIALLLLSTKTSTTNFAIAASLALIGFYSFVTYGLFKGKASACRRAVRVHSILAAFAVFSALMSMMNLFSLAIQIVSLSWHAASALVTFLARDQFRS